MKFLLIFATQFVFLLAESTIYSPSLLLHEQHGPLYEGVKLLLADEQFHAELTWNATVLVLNETAQRLQQSIAQMHTYGSIIEAHLQQLNSIDRPERYGQCLKQYEREVAHFNRELLRKYAVCLQTLNATVEHLENETVAEIAFVQNATAEIRHVAGACHARSLRRSSSDQAGVTLCVVSRIGQIDQRLFDAAQLILDIIADVAVINGEEDGDAEDSSESCQDFNDMREEFDAVYYQITVCVGNGMSLV